jgi:D-glycero-D-manno-heptose 1,7-bisphosphate phosphatase
MTGFDPKKARAAVFLDRDGTIIEDKHYLKNAADVELIPGAGPALREMSAKGYLLFVVSNQSGLSRGLIADDEFLAVHRRVCELLQAVQVDIAEFAYCFHHPDDRCTCRKPRPGLVPRAYHQRPIDWHASYTVGDKSCDIELAAAIGGSGYLVLTGKGRNTWENLQTASPILGYQVRATLQEVARDLPPVAPQD